MRAKLAIVGCAGIPNRYGGFEELAEQLAYKVTDVSVDTLYVYCQASSRGADDAFQFKGVELKYIPLPANGIGAVFYDLVSFVDAIFIRKASCVLVLGVSAAIPIAMITSLCRAPRVVMNVDGREWRRRKWGLLARVFLKLCEAIAMRSRIEVIADNEFLRHELLVEYPAKSVKVIPYGGDAQGFHSFIRWENQKALSYIAIARVEPENNIGIILEASMLVNASLILVGDFAATRTGRDLLAAYQNVNTFKFMGAIYYRPRLEEVRTKAQVYIHGHSAGGTNPTLVEAMTRGQCVIAFDCGYNRSTTEGKALYFKTVPDLVQILRSLSMHEAKSIGEHMAEIAVRRYTWEHISQEYFSVLLRE